MLEKLDGLVNQYEDRKLGIGQLEFFESIDLMLEKFGVVLLDIDYIFEIRN